MDSFSGLNVALLVGALVASAGFLLRQAFILAGWLKGPIMKRCETYTDHDDLYYPLPALLLGFGGLLLSGGLLLNVLSGSKFPTYLIGGALLALAALAHELPDVLRVHPGTLMRYPRWYFDLRAHTTRDERRRIAYLWLKLPRRARWLYSTNEWAFRQWRDMVIASLIVRSWDDLMDGRRVWRPR